MDNTTDAVAVARSDAQVAFETGFVLPRGKSAIVAEVSEDWTTPIDTMAGRFAGVVFRRAKGDIRSDVWNDDYSDYLFPYDYQPVFA